MKITKVNNNSLIHARKTVTFTGAAGLGAVGSVDIFTITGRVLIEYFTVFCTDTLTQAAPTSNIEIGSASDHNALRASSAVTALVTSDWWAASGNVPGMVQSDSALNNSSVNGDPLLSSEDIIATIATQNCTGGTLIFDVWYLPITDNGALTAA